ncbi:MAG: hypothetical protein ACOC2E_01205 [Bacteroidota bacterium]
MGVTGSVNKEVNFYKTIFLVVCFLMVYLMPLSAADPKKDDALDAGHNQQPEKFDAGKVIIDHILDSYEWHIADYGDTHITIPLPVILVYEGEFYLFMSSKFHHGHDAYKGFRIAKEGAKK